MNRVLVYCYFCPSDTDKLGGVQQIVGPLLNRLDSRENWAVSVIHRGSCSADTHYELPDSRGKARPETVDPDTAGDVAEYFRDTAMQHDVVLSIDRILPASVPVPCVLMSNTIGYEMQATAVRANHWSRIIVPTSFHGDYVERLNPNPTVSVVHYGLPPNQLQQGTSIDPVSWGEEPIIIRLPHRPDPRKGHREAIEGLGEAMPEADHVNLEITWFDEEDSTDTYRTELERLADNLGVEDNVLFTPWVSGPVKWRALARSSGVLALGDIKETFGLAIVEAVLCGRPVLVHRQPASREIVGQTNLLQELQRPQDWYWALDEYYTNRSLEEEQRVREELKQTLSLEQMVSSYEQLLLEECNQVSA